MSEHSHQRAAGQRHPEQVVEDDVGDQGEDGRDERIAVEVRGCRARRPRPRRAARPRRGSRAGSMRTAAPRNTPASSSTVRQSAGSDRSMSSPLSASPRPPRRTSTASRAAIEQQPGADDDGHGLRADGAALGDVDVHGERVGQDEHAECQQQHADAEFGVLAQPGAALGRGAAAGVSVASRRSQSQLLQHRDHALVLRRPGSRRTRRRSGRRRPSRSASSTPATAGSRAAPRPGRMSLSRSASVRPGGATMPRQLVKFDVVARPPAGWARRARRPAPGR